MTIDYRFMGRVSIDEIHKFYINNSVDCFLHCSESEGGCPLAIAEAMSYGIPVIATRAGGVSEMIAGNGTIMDTFATAETIGQAILDMIGLKENEIVYRQKCKNSREIWENGFNSRLNAKEFANYLRGLQKGKIKKIVLVIDSLENDWCFIESELAELCLCAQVCLIEMNSGGTDIKELLELYGKNVEYYAYTNEISVGEKINTLFKFVFSSEIMKEKESIIDGSTNILTRLIESYKYYLKAQAFLKWLRNKKILSENCDKIVYYTFWHTPATLAPILNKSKFPGIKIITREHGYDLYDERYLRGKRQPFRDYMDSLLDGVIFACEAGRNYYEEKRNNRSNFNKYMVFRLGSREVDRDIADLKLARPLDDRSFNIVSCSNVISLKRIDLIIDALKYASKHTKCNIRWTHFGDGSDFDKVKNYASNTFDVC